MEYSEPRGARPEELAQVVGLSNSVFRSSRGGMRDEFPILFASRNAEHLRIITSGGEPVSLIGAIREEISFYGHRVRVAGIGSVCTHPEHRNRGLASRLLHDTERFLRKQGVALMLISGRRGLYLRNDCFEFGAFVSFDVAGDLRCDSLPRVEVEECTGASGEAVDALVRIHQREPVRYIRTRRETEMRLTAHFVHRKMNREHVLYLAGDATHPSAYILLALGEGRKSGQVIEYAGRRSHIASTLAGIVRGEGPRAVRLVVPGQDRELVEILRGMGLCGERTTYPGHTMKVINFEALIAGLSGYLREWVPHARFEGEPGRVLVSYEDQGEDQRHEYVFPHQRRMQAFFFGPDREAKDIPSEGSGSLRDQLLGAFPLQVVTAGLNYV